MSNVPTATYRRLGNSGLLVSVPIFGAMSIGNDAWASWVLNEDKALPLLKAAWDRGITTIDTANIYSHGDSENIIGKFIKQYNIPREKLLILTKCFNYVEEDPKTSSLTQSSGPLAQRDRANQRGLSRAAIFNQVNASLKRLDTDYIDLLQIHRFDPETPVAETMKALHDLVESGKVRYIGASSMRAWQFSEMNHVAEMHGWTKFVSMQNEYSLLYREDEREMHAYCNHHGIGLIPWGPLQAGDLARPLSAQSTRKEWTKDTPFRFEPTAAEKTIIERTEEIATKRGWKMSQVALAWVNTKVTSPIVGYNSVERIEESINPDKALTEEEIKYLEEPYAPRPVRNHA